MCGQHLVPLVLHKRGRVFLKKEARIGWLRAVQTGRGKAGSEERA